MAEDEELPEDVMKRTYKVDTIVLGGYYSARPEDELLHPSRVGGNHRGTSMHFSVLPVAHCFTGGCPGFVRIRKDKQTIVLPDYSGNRFMQTLGCIEANPVASITFVDWASGDMVFVTGRATNHYLEDAQKLMNLVNLVTTSETMGYIFAKNMLNVRQRPGTEVKSSPYNPPIRYLVKEHSEKDALYDGVTVALTKTVIHSPVTATFTFTASQTLTILPGQSVVINMHAWSGKLAYQHVARAGQEARLNDNGVRTWMISSSHTNSSTKEFSLTLALKQLRSITPKLFDVVRTAA
jgi:hypothetical protein